MKVLLWVVVGLPLVVGVGLALARGRSGRTAVGVALATAATVLLLTVGVAIDRPAVSAPFLFGSPAKLAVDALAAPILVTVSVVTLLVLLFSVADVRESRSRFFGLMLIFASAVLLTLTAQTLPTLLLGWEVMGATSYALIGFFWRDSIRVRAGQTAFLTTRLADLGLYIAAGAALAGGQGVMSLDRLGELSSGWRNVAVAGVLVAAFGKAAQLPFSFWLSRAMEGPSPVSALLHSAAMVAMGGYLLLRVSPALPTTGWADDTTAWVGAVTALVLGLVAVAQRDLKQLLAASTAAQLAFVVLAAGTGGVTSGAMQLIAHAATKALLFLAAGAWLSALGTKSLSALRGAARLFPLVGATFAVGALALAGLPPLSLWATKDEVLAAAADKSIALYAVGLAAAAVSAVYAGKALVVVLQPLPADAEQRYDTEWQGNRHVGRMQKLPLVVLAVGAATLGVQALPAVADRFRDALGVPNEPAPGLLALLVSAAVAAAGLALAFARPERPLPLPGLALEWLRLEDVAHLLAVRPTLAIARACAAADVVIHRLVLAMPVVAVALARRIRRLDTAGVDGAVQMLIRGVARLGRLARRPQTGQLHQYYAQMAAGLAAGLLLLLLLSVR